jgi:hypothetical protein
MNITFKPHELLPGTQVRLKSDLEGQPGVIERIVAGKALVRWPHCTTRHAADALITVPASEARKLNPYERLIAKLDRDNGRG